MKKVLIVDDAPSGLLFLRQMLSQPFITLFEAASGRHALDLHRREKMDLIVTDLHMPGMDGDQLSRAIRADPALRQVSILIVADSIQHGSRQQCLAAGANDFLAKPFKTSDLLSRTGQLLNVAPRRDTQLLAHVEKSGGSPQPFVGRIVNLSTSGMLLQTEVALEVGMDLTIRFFIPGGATQARMTGRIVRMMLQPGANRWGIRFTTVDEANRQPLRLYTGAADGSPSP